nr:MAG TPA: hypothetical protein [Caudoviricetes sp.]
MKCVWLDPHSKGGGFVICITEIMHPIHVISNYNMVY